jgi:transcription-repair coupling factor (superfamily II helicase)
MQSIMSIPAIPRRGASRSLIQLPGNSDALTIAQASAQSERLTVVITNDTAGAETLKETIAFFNHGSDGVLHFPDRETLPYDNFSPHQDITSERLLSLYQLPQRQSGVLVIPITALMHRLPPLEYVLQNSLQMASGDQLSPEQLSQRLTHAGYRRVDTVMEHGEFAVRGSLVDLFPMGTRLPLRIDFFDDIIESLRSFDPDTQRSLEKAQEFRLLPAREMPLTAASIKLFKEHWHARFTVKHQHCPTYRDVSDALAPPGIEYYLPLFFEQTVLLTAYLPDDCLLILEQGTHQAAEHFWSDVCNRYDELNIDPRRPLLPPKELFATSEEIFAELRPHPRFELLRDEPEIAPHHADTMPFLPCPDVVADARKQAPWHKLLEFSKQWRGRILLTAESPGRREALLEQLHSIGLRPETLSDWQAFAEGDIKLGITVAPLSGAFLLGDDLAVIPESDLLGGRVSQQRRETKTRDGADAIIRNLAELTIGAAVVHIDHGVGRYLGLQCLDVNDAPVEFLLLQYAEDAKLYVPVSSLHLINRYTGVADDMAPLHRLGSDTWRRERDKAAKQIRDAAAELLEIYARRAAQPGNALEIAADDYQRFAAEFPFEETPDQRDAIKAVENDLARHTPMDRLICGDVGFGKTEVAMRAAFIAVQNGRQVAILVPTTLLAQQHYDTFRDRFAEWPFNIEQMSRFRSAKQQTDAKQRLASGQADIVIGTHKLLQGDIQYHNLGLLIIDEEHRFGVRQKERLKALRAQVDILTLTATPIPRTLNMSLAGMRDLSIIATPPAKRLAIKTFVREYNQGAIKEALLRELLRGGQVYFVHNDVSTIERTARELSEMVPEARVAIGHGQMRERDLEQVMSDFHHKKHNILVCTTIIETGIDIPSANTIIIERADKFGLAQLHQLRGRVGRSHHQAYAYLLTPHSKAMSADAGKRLEAIAEAQELGSGFVLATHDLEIRGTGELLGEEQSGHIQKIGFTLYMDMLERAVTALKQGKKISDRSTEIHDTQINLNIAAIIPDDYLSDVHTRLTLYKRIANAANEQQLRELQVEMIDRFGLLPEHTKQLFRVTEIKLRCEPLGIAKIDANGQGGKLLFEQDTPVDPMTLVKLVQTQPDCFRLEAGNQLRFQRELTEADSRITFICSLLEQLQPQAA